MSDAVAVTGIGIVSPIGSGRAVFWDALREGRSGIRPIEGAAAAGGFPRIGAAVGEFPARELITSPQLRRMDRLSRMAVAAARLAMIDAQLDAAALSGERAGIVFGTALGNIEESGGYLDRVYQRGPAAASPMTFPNLVLNAPAGYIAMELGCTGTNFTVAQAEVSGEHAIALGCDVLRSGRADLVLAGGGDQLSAVPMHGYRRAGALAGQHGGREWSSPYDAARSGVVLGEGVALLALEPLAAARRRGAPICAVIDGTARFAVPSSRYDWPAHADAALAPLRGLLEGALPDLLCGSANSTHRLDRCELELFAALCGARAGDAALTSIKGAIGEFGAAGALSVAAVCLGLHEQAVPPLCHLQSLATDAPFRVAAPRAVAAKLDRALVSGLARGGAGVALSLRRFL